MANYNKQDFSQGSVMMSIMRIALPMMVAQFINVLYNIVDRIYIGRMGDGATNALTGLGVCLPIITIVMAFSNLVSTGGSPLFSISRGSGNEREAQKLLGNSFCLLIIYGIALTIFIYIFHIPILKLLGASSETLPYACDYITIYASGTIFVMLSLGLNSFINAQGFAKTGMMTVIIGAILNILLDPLFIFALDMGVKGAAAATVISQFASAVWTLRFLTGKRTLIKISLPSMKLESKRVKKITVLGLSGFIMASTNSIVSMTCNATLSVWGGDMYIAIMTIISSVRDVVQMPVLGITNGIQPVIGFNYGARLNNRVKTAIRDSAVILIGYTGIMWLIVIFFASGFFGMFTSDTNVIQTGITPLHIYFFGFVFMALQFTGQSVFTGLGKSKQSIIFSLLRKVIIVVPLTILLPYKFGVNGVFMAEPISNIVGGTTCFVTMIFTVYKKLK